MNKIEVEKMCWFDREERAYEARTLRMIDSIYTPQVCSCVVCDQCFYEDDSIKSEYKEKLDFCSSECRDNWNDENKHDYIDEEVI